MGPHVERSCWISSGRFCMSHSSCLKFPCHLIHFIYVFILRSSRVYVDSSTFDYNLSGAMLLASCGRLRIEKACVAASSQGRQDEAYTRAHGIVLNIVVG